MIDVDLKKKSYYRIRTVLFGGMMLICIAALAGLAGAIEADGYFKGAPLRKDLAKLERRVADIWGGGNVWLPRPSVWVQYERDLGERSAVDFESGVVRLQILLKASDDPHREPVRAHLRQGVGNLILGEAKDPLETIKEPESEPHPGRKDGTAEIASGKEIRVYLVRRGDSLWKIARQFRMTTEELAELNGLAADEILQAGLPLKVLVFSSHNLTLDSSPRFSGKDPLLINQIRMADGRPVPPRLVRDFAAEVVDGSPLSAEKVVGADGIERRMVSVAFKLVSNHLEVRARKFYPLALRYAKRNQLDPALIMAIIHTESVFNPRARSDTPAFGLMQVVPYGGGREAYRAIYHQRRKLTPKYLYDPKNNIELGTAYFNLLESRYLDGILNSESRTYCAVAAYNAGAANVGSAFISKKSINQATPAINLLEPQKVYERLVKALPFKESRNYVRSVMRRVGIYRKWK